jgi:hypothetical protein
MGKDVHRFYVTHIDGNIALSKYRVIHERLPMKISLYATETTISNCF